MIKWTQAGLKIAHLGDLGQDQLTEAQAAELRNLDILFIPAGGFFTITPERAAAYVKELNPRIAILMHYRTGIGGPAQLAGVPAASEPFSPVVYKPAAVAVKPGALPVAPEVWVMQPASDTVAVNGAAFTAGAPVAPGSVISFFGSFRGSQTGGAQAYPLPRKIGETEVLVDGKPVPLFYVSPGQVNAQVSVAQAVGPAAADIRVGGQSVGRAPLTIVPVAPGLFGAVNPDGKLNSSGSPARRGEVLQIFGTGQGTVTPPVEDGAAAGPISRARPQRVSGRPPVDSSVQRPGAGFGGSLAAQRPDTQGRPHRPGPGAFRRAGNALCQYDRGGCGVIIAFRGRQSLCRAPCLAHRRKGVA